MFESLALAATINRRWGAPFRSKSVHLASRQHDVLFGYEGNRRFRSPCSSRYARGQRRPARPPRITGCGQAGPQSRRSHESRNKGSASVA